MDVIYAEHHYAVRCYDKCHYAKYHGTQITEPGQMLYLFSSSVSDKEKNVFKRFTPGPNIIKTFYGCNLQIFIISLCDYPLLAFPA